MAIFEWGTVKWFFFCFPHSCIFPDGSSLLSSLKEGWKKKQERKLLPLVLLFASWLSPCIWNHFCGLSNISEPKFIFLPPSLLNLYLWWWLGLNLGPLQSQPWKTFYITNPLSTTKFTFLSRTQKATLSAYIDSVFSTNVSTWQARISKRWTVSPAAWCV